MVVDPTRWEELVWLDRWVAGWDCQYLLEALGSQYIYYRTVIFTTLCGEYYSPRAASLVRSSGEVNYYSKIYLFSDLSRKIKTRWLHKFVFHHGEEGPPQSRRALDSKAWPGACSRGLYAELEAVKVGAATTTEGCCFARTLWRASVAAAKSAACVREGHGECLLSTESCLPRCTTRRGPRPQLQLRLGRLDWYPSIIAAISSVSKILLSARAFSQIDGLFNVCELLHLSFSQIDGLFNVCELLHLSGVLAN
jgi:hypothetical protein